jgi:hypothetical protein
MADDARRRRLLLLVKILPPVVLALICLAGIEIFARIVYARPSMHFGLEMWKYAKQLKIRAENKQMSHRHRPNSEAFLMGVDVKINSLGLRDYEVTLQKPPDAYRIVVLGDSTTLGWGVQKDQFGRVPRPLAPPPVAARPGNVRPVLFDGAEHLFLYVRPIFSST